MYLHKIKKLLIVALLVTFLMIVGSSAREYIPSNRDTKLPPEPMTFVNDTPRDFTLLYETEHLKFYFKDERDIIAIYDKRNGYTWKTGLDIPFARDIDDRISEALEKGETPVYEPKEDKLNTTYSMLANSLVTIEYYDESNNIKRTSSSPYGRECSELKKYADDYYRLDVSFSAIDVSLKVHIHFDDKGIRYEVKDEEIQGEDVDILAAVVFSPFMGASGGVKVHWNEDDQDYTTHVPNGMIPGYVLVPDGSGALIRFQNNDTTLKTYIGDVYGPDYSQATYYYAWDQGYVPFKNPKMPVFGIAHGNKQNAFCSYATEGAEFMEIIVSPEENLTHYTWAYPRFVYNVLFHQVYNKKGDGYFTQLGERNHFNISLRYDFLQGDGTNGEPSADYIGMAANYRRHLIETGQLKTKHIAGDHIPIRLDFVMADVKKSVLGYEDVVVTTARQAQNILDDVHTGGITRISSGLLGFQSGGITLGKPWKAGWSSHIGTRKDFEQLIKSAKEKGIDVSFAQDYTTINEEQMTLPSNAAKHANGWLNEYYYSRFSSFPIREVTYAKVNKSAEWLKKQAEEFTKLSISSLTIDGISHTLLSDYSNNGNTVGEAISLYQALFNDLNQNHKINAVSPNAYLWPYVDRFLNTPVFSTQYVMETDTVPFLEMVLSGNMELYGPYCNFSFYTDKDVLRMIDYNVYPSFLLSHASSHYLASTNSANFYSTEYSLYRELIQKIYTQVDGALRNVMNSKWTNREVLDNGIVLNTYDNGVRILINYSDNPYHYQNVAVEAMSYHVYQ